eukprot:scaffold663_cov86-Skeletonema_marinoi.AAC.2
MPNNKKNKRGGAKKKAAAAPQAAADITVAVGDLSLDAYPQHETPAQTLQRILGYKYLSDKDGRPICINLHEKNEEGGDKYVIEYLDVNRRFVVNTAYLHKMMAVLVPDYDRNSAEFPVAMEIMDRKPKDLSRKVLKCVNSVPAGKRDVFKKFVTREGISVECMKIVKPPEYGGDGAPSYYFRVILLGYENEMIVINASPTNHIVAYGGVAYEGSLHYKLPEKYHKELTLLLMNECMERIVSGTANINKSMMALFDEKLVATPNELVTALAKCIRATCIDMKRWGELIRLQMFLLEWAVKNKASLHSAAEIAAQLGESLEARGHQIQAALVYTECGEHLLAAKHPSASQLFCYAGLAWKRGKDWEKGEAFYAAALENLHLQYDPQRYHGGLFNYFVNLWMCWQDTENPNCPDDLVATLRALIIAAGEPSPSAGYDHLFRTNAPYLREDLRAASTEYVCCVLASIARESTSVGAMRTAIKKCATPNLQSFGAVVGTAEAERDRKTENKEAARKEYFGKGIGILVTCDECGELKDEKVLKRCGAW